MGEVEIIKWKKQCLSKYRYKTKVFAEASALKMTKKHGKATRVYACPQCGNYHLTTSKEYAKKS